jgi:hypothetical protein
MFFLTSKENGYISASRAIPLQAWTGPEGSRRLRLPDFNITASRAPKVFEAGNLVVKVLLGTPLKINMNSSLCNETLFVVICYKTADFFRIFGLFSLNSLGFYRGFLNTFPYDIYWWCRST